MMYIKRFELLTIGLLISGCSAPPPEGQGHEAAPADDHTIGVQEAIGAVSEIVPSRITLATVPNAVCHAHPPRTLEPADVIEITADDQGIVSLYTNRAPSASQETLLIVDCVEDEGKLVTSSLDLREESTFMPAVPRKKYHRTMRPALLGDPLGPTQAELVQSGYPPRPPVESDLYSVWLESVSKPTVILPRIPGRSRVRAGLVPNSQAGTYMSPTTVNAPAYGWVTNSMQVPFLATSPAGLLAWWAGIQSIPASNVTPKSGLIQAGIFLQTNNIAGAATAFYEYYPDVSITVPNLQITYGNTILTDSWSSSNSGCTTIDTTGAFGCFQIENTSLNPPVTTPVYVVGKNTGSRPWNGRLVAVAIEKESANVPEFITIDPKNGGAYTNTISQTSVALAADGFHSLSTDPYNTANINSASSELVSGSGIAPSTTSVTWLRGN